MGIQSRKLYVWLITFGGVLVIYLCYNWLSETPRIKVSDTRIEHPGAAADFDSNKIGMVGDVGVGTVRNAKYAHLNKNKQVDREFGFEKLLHEEGKEWEIEKPYMDIFERSLKCHITADKGRATIEDALGRPSPRDVTLTGNVVIRILPQGDSRIKESFIYLDYVDYIGEKSQFSTDGPVRFVNSDALMLGKGLEFIYNKDKDRIEFLRIIHLDSLHLKTSSRASLFSSDRPAGGAQSKTQPSSAPAAANIHQEQKSSFDKTENRNANKSYRCVLSKNVAISTPEQLVFADKILVSNIVSNEKSAGSGTIVADNSKAESQNITGKPVAGDNNAASAEPNNSFKQPADIIVTCDNGIFVTPTDSPQIYGNYDVPDSNATTAVSRSTQETNNADGRATFAAAVIDYNAATGDTTADGNSELTFYVNDIIAADANNQAVPVKITARKKVQFLPAAKKAIFEGDSLCIMLRQSLGVQYRYTLSSPKFTANLSNNKSSPSSASVIGIEHFTADGGTVRLATLKNSGEKFLGGIELKCRRFDYDPNRRVSLATGPGIITADNSRIPEPNTSVGRFSLQKPCWAFVRDFDTLKYSTGSNRIVADADPQGALRLDYIPVNNGQYGQQVFATAPHVEIEFADTAGGQNKLEKLLATGGITYEEETNGKNKNGKDVQFVGSEMFYDTDKSAIKARGNQSQPCILNGVLVDGIEYDLKTGRIKNKIIGPGFW